MTDKEILDKYIDLEKLCLMEKEKKGMMEMLYKYKDVFSLRHEIGTCPNIDFRHLNVRKTKKNLAYPLLKDTFLVLGSSKCNVLPVLHLKRCIPLLAIVKNTQRNTVEYFLTLVAHLTYVKECPQDLIYPPQYSNLTSMQFVIYHKPKAM